MTLPWDRFGPDEPELELPYVPPPVSLPIPNPDRPPVKPIDDLIDRVQPTSMPTVDWDDLLDGAWPMLKDQLIGYVKGTLKAEGTVDHAHPTVTAETVTGKELVIADAKSRSWRTLVQGLVIDICAALIVILGTITQLDPPLDKAAWIAVGAMAVKTLIQAVLSYFMRIHIQPTVRSEGEKMAVMPLVVPIPEKEVGKHER